MSVLDLIHRAGNALNHDVVAPVQRNVFQPINTLEQATVAHVERPVVKAWQSVNPNSGYNQAKPIVSAAQSQYGFTPQFSAIVNGANPSLSPQFNRNPLLSSGVTAIAQFNHQAPVNQIQLTNQGNSPDTLVHEALHREWQVNPNDHGSFVSAYMAGASPALRSYLASRLSGYKQFDSGPTSQLMNINQAAPDIQNEIHSYIPQYYASNRMSYPAPLANYYSQFFNPAAATRPAPTPVAPAAPIQSKGHGILGMIGKR